MKPPGIEGISETSVWTGKAWKSVKNLGWLLTHWKDIKSLEVIKSRRQGTDATLIAYMRDSKVFATPFADRSVLAKFLNRPVFEGRDVFWFGTRTKVSGALR